MKFREVLLPLVFSLAISACATKETDSKTSSVNPPADGFDMENSDPAAIELADSIMKAMGGRQSWDNTRHISWNFGGRTLVWDKTLGRVRIESNKDTITYLVNLNTLQGRVQIKGQELLEKDSLEKMVLKAKSMWINDSYWLVMPFKLKDTGVKIKYMGEETLADATQCNVLELTFNNVGDTPQNKYRLYVDLSDNLVKQWAYYNQATQDSANFVRPWDNYKKYGSILLSADRSDGAGPKNVKVDQDLAEAIFTEF